MFNKESETPIVDYNQHNPLWCALETIARPLLYSFCSVIIYNNKSTEASVMAGIAISLMLIWEYRHTVRVHMAEQHWYNVHKLIRHSSQNANRPTRIGITKDAHIQYKVHGSFNDHEETL